MTVETTNLTGVKTAEEALEKAGCLWTADEHGLMTQSGHDVPTHKALLRSDTNQQVGIVGIDYKPMQNNYSFAYFDSILKEHGIKWTQSVVIDGGAKIILKAQFPKKVLIRVGDECMKEIVLINSFNMSSSFTAYFRMERLVCSNGQVSSSKHNKIAFKHTENAEFRANSALAMFSKSVTYFEEFITQSQRLAEVTADKKMVDNFLKSVFPEKETTRSKNQKEEVTNLFNTGMGNGQGTAWDLYNGYTEWIDHNRTPDDDKRLVSALIGDGNNKKEKAFSKLITMAG